MIRKIESLLKFQDVEIEMERLNSVLGALPEKISAMEAQKQLLQEAYNSEMEAVAARKKKYREMDGELQTSAARIKKSQEKLTAVKTNKEYQAILKEIDDIKEKISSLEEEMIQFLEEIEFSEKDLAVKGEALRQHQMKIDVEKETIEREAEMDRNRLEAARETVGQLAGDVDSVLLADYHRIKKIVKTRPLVPAIKAVCQGCHLNIPPQMYNELQRGDQLKFCPHCGRIIFWSEMIA